MKVILLRNLGKLGSEGNQIEVKDGYACNYLIPQGVALRATDANRKKLQEIIKTRGKTAEKEKLEFSRLKDKIEKISLTLSVEAKENEELYGTIGEVQILKALKVEGVDLNKGTIALPEAIKKIGIYNVKIILASDIEADLRVWIVKK